MNITKNHKFDRVAPNDGATTTFTLAAGTTDVNSVAVDTLGFASAAFLIVFGALTASMTCGLQVEGSVNGTDGWTAITGAVYNGTAATDDDKGVLIEVGKPQYRYLRVAFNRETANVVIDGLFSILGSPRVGAVTQGTMIEASVVVSS